MARGVLTHVTQRKDAANRLSVAGGAEVTVYEMDGVTPIAQTMYTARTGGAVLSNPLTADTSGLIKAYVPIPQACLVEVNGVQTPTAFEADPDDMLLVPAISGDRPIIDVRLHGAAGDGVTDDRAAIQAAIDALPSSGGTILLTGGAGTTYLINSTGGTFTFKTDSGAPLLALTTDNTVSYALQLRSNIDVRTDGAVVKRGVALQAANTFVMAGTTALENVTIQGVTFDQGVTSTTINTNIGSLGRLLSFYTGSENILVDRCKFINVGTHLVLETGSDDPLAAVQSRGITYRKCIIERSLPGPVQSGGLNGPENTGTVGLRNASDVLIEDCHWRSTLTGATAAVSGLAVAPSSHIACTDDDPMVRVTVRGCTFTSVQATALIFRGTAGTYGHSWKVEGCTYTKGGAMVEKGFLGLQDLQSGRNVTYGVPEVYNVHVVNNTVKMFGYANSSAGDADNVGGPAAIDVGGDVVLGLVVAGNTIDGSDGSGGIPFSGETAPNGKAVGIHIGAGVVGAQVYGNTCQVIGGAGIQAAGSATLPVYRLAIFGNTVMATCLKDTAATIHAGILIGDFVTDFSITNNICNNNGSGEASAVPAGIGFTESAAATSITQTGVISGNICRNDSGTNQQYGIRVGFSGGAILKRPLGIKIIDNDCNNNTVAAIYADTTYGANSRSYHIENNRGWQSAAPTASTMTALMATDTALTQNITVTGATVGDHVTFSHTATTMPAGLAISATVTAANTVTITIFNPTAGNLTPVACDWRVRVAHRNLA